ncbi:MAG TPA: flagellar hook protein FlgE [Chloroflexota bacterium]|nr:flagellar hook protein FlgE [Chloroflexota bacterium]
MMRSMFAAISGLKNHQTMMDVVGNNIANVNTTGFKQSRVAFADILSQTVRGATGPQNGRGGINAEQIGTGVGLASIDTIQTQGTNQATGKATDMAIQGDGYFAMSDGKQNFYTRDGGFDLALDGTLVNPSNGLHVQGWGVTAATAPVTVAGVTTPGTPAVVNTAAVPGNISIPIGAGMVGMVSSSIGVTGNLDANEVPTVAYKQDSASGTVDGVQPTFAPIGLSTTAYDSLGNPIQLTIAATPVNSPWKTTWGPPIVAGVPTTPTTVPGALTGWSVVVNTVPPQAVPPAPIAVTFNAFGKIATGGTSPLSFALGNGAVTPQTLSLDLSKLTQLNSSSDMIATADGASAGTLTSFTVGQFGDITGVYSNGFKQALGQIAMASFTNPSGLTKTGGNLFASSPNSGNVNIGIPGTNGTGTIATGFLEGSNVDLAQQFTNMIMAERGFQANSKVITTSDEILQDLVNLKH